MIIHIDMDAFFASIEQAINPRLKGKPLIVGSRENKYHTVVCAASYEAKCLGIDSGMPTKEAFQICPEAEFIATDSAKYLYVSEQIFQMLKAYPCQLHYSSVDEFDLEFPTMDKNHYLSLAQEIKNKIKNSFQITCSIGIAPNWQLAKLGSKTEKPDGLVFIDQSNYLDILNGISIGKICGVGPTLTTQLNDLGIKTCKQLIRYPKQLLVHKFGKIGSWLADCLKPQNYVPIQDDPDSPNIPKSIGHSYTLPRQTSNPQIIFAWIRMLCEMIAQRLRKLGVESQTIHVWVNSSLNRGFSKQKTFQTRASLGSDIFMRSIAILGLKKGNKTTLRLRAIGISVSGLCPKSQPPLLKKEKIEEDIALMIDKINDKYGDWTIYPAILELTSKNRI